jgi:hypothetical protein
MRARHGEASVPLILNGACGNINPWSPYDPDYVEDYRYMGRTLAETTDKVVEQMLFKEIDTLNWGVNHLQIPLKEVQPQALEAAQQLINDHPHGLWIEGRNDKHVDQRWMQAAGVVSVHLARLREPKLDYEIQVLRIGDVAIVGLPGEPFVEGQLRIKLASPTYPTYVAHATSHIAGYIPTAEAFPRGGHEIAVASWARLVPEALDMIVDGSTVLLNELFKA